jgi:hypothetical protein
MKRRIITTVLAAVGLTSTFHVASAASVGGLSADTLSAHVNSTRAIIAFDSFAGTGGSAIGGTTTDTPPLPYATPWTNYTWVDYGGTWRYLANRARCTASVAGGNLGFNTATHEMSVEANLRRTGGSYDMSVMTNDTGSHSFLARVRTNTGTTSWLELVAWGTGFTTLAQVSIPIATQYRVRIESYGNASAATMKVFLNGSLQINHTLTAADAALAHNPSAVGVGLVCNSDTGARFDFFHVDV